MSRETQTPEELTRYLLGELPEEERARVEDAFLGDEALFEQVADAERDLVDDYVGGRLSARERERFEQHYLQLPGSRERLRTARLVARGRAEVSATPAPDAASVTHASGAAGEPARAARAEPERAGFFESLRAFWRDVLPSMTPYALGLAVLALAVGGLWWAAMRDARVGQGSAPELAETRTTPTPPAETQTPKPPAQPDANANTNTPDVNANAPSLNANAPTTSAPSVNAPEVRGGAPAPTPREARPTPAPTPARTPTEPRRVTVLALVAGLTRGEGEANKLVVPKGADAVRFEFDAGGGGYADVRASLRTVEGREVWSGAVARAGRRTTLTLPARLFADEDYLLVISGADKSGARVEFQEFYFNAEVR